MDDDEEKHSQNKKEYVPRAHTQNSIVQFYTHQKNMANAIELRLFFLLYSKLSLF